MQRKQLVKYNSYQTVVSLLKNNPERTAKIPALLKDAADLETMMQNIIAAEKQSKLSTTEITSAKGETRTKLANAIYTLASAVVSYAASVKNKSLMQTADVSMSQLNSARESELPLLCRRVLDEARKSLANLADYGIIADDLATTDTLLTVFETQLPETSVMQSQKVSGSKSKIDWFKEADAIIEKRLMRTAIKLKDIDNEFYQQLENAASPNEPYSQSTTIEVHVVGKASQKPAHNADISIPELGMMATTNHQGVFISKIASKKNISMQVMKMNHKPVVLEGLHLRKGKKNVFRLEIEEA